MSLDAREPCTLADLATDPDLTAALPRADVAKFYGQVARLEAALRARLLADPANAPVSPIEDVLLDMPAAARLLGLPEGKVREMGRRGQLPVVVIGKYRRVSRRALEAFIAGTHRDLDGPRSITLPLVSSI